MFTGVVTRFSDGNSFGVKGDFAATITWADGSTSPGTIQADPGGGFDVVGSHIYKQDGNFSITTTITSIDVSPPITPSSTAATSAIVVSDAPILASATQLPNGVEGSAYPGPITVATFTDGNPYVVAGNFSAIITWGDGQSSAGMVIPDPHIVGQFDVQGNHTYVEDGIYVGSVTITDTAGSPAVPQATAAVALSATVLDASLVAGPAVSVPNQVAGQLFSGVVGTFSDGNPFANDPNTYLVSIFWGDGTQPSAGTVVQTGPATFQVLGTHTYIQEAPTGASNSHPYRVTVQITDIDADQLPPPPPSIPRSTTSTITSITVTVASLSLMNATIPAQTEGQSELITLATLADDNPYDTPDAYTGTIAWGDGSTSTLIAANYVPVMNSPGHFRIVASHTYVEEGSYSVTTQVWNTNGGLRPTGSPLNSYASTTTSISVADALLTSVGTPKTITTTPDGSPIYEGSPTGNIVVATFQDANTFATPADYTVTIAWGDGTTSAGTVQPSLNPGLFNVYANHTYKERGSYNNLEVTITDDGGASTTAANASIVVSDASLIPGTSPIMIQTFAGIPLGGRLVGSFADANPFAMPSDFTATIDWGDGSSSPATAIITELVNSSGATFGVVGDHTYTYNGSYSVVVTVNDTEGTSVVGSSTIISQTTVMITLDPPPDNGGGSSGSPFVVNAVSSTATEESSFTGTVAAFTYFTAAVPADFTAAIAWGDGQSSDGTIGYDPTANTFVVAGSHTYAQAGSYTQSVTITDQGGNSAQVTGTVTVAAALTDIAGVAISATEGAAFSGVVASFVDANPAAAPADFTVAIAWGDGQTSAGTIAYDAANGVFTVSGSNTYAQAGSYSPTVSIHDLGGATALATASAAIADAPLTAAGVTLSATEGAPFSGLVATFTDGNPGAVPADFTATIAWGDGHSSAGSIAYDAAHGVFTVSGSNTYAQAGSYSPTVSIHDLGGATALATASAAIADAPLSAAGTSIKATEGAGFGGVVATFTDANPFATASSFTATIAWGDGHTSVGTIAYDAAHGVFTVSGSNTYAQAGSYSPTVSIHDLGGATALATASAAIADAPLSAAGTSIKATEGAGFGGVVATFTDANPFATASSFTATIAWGDGHSSAGSIVYDAANGAFTVSGSNTYAQAGSYSPTVSIHDLGGATALATASAAIADAPLTAAGTSVNSVVGTAFSGVMATFIDPNALATPSSFTTSITWGDGNSSSGIVVYDAAQKTFAVSGAHTYARAGSYHPIVSIHGLGGTVALATTTLTVTDASLIANGFNIIAVRASRFTGVVATLIDANPAEGPSNFVAKIYWGNGRFTLGKITQPGGPGTKFVVTGTHVYSRAGKTTIRVSITQKTGIQSAGASGKVRVLSRKPPVPRPAAPHRPKAAVVNRPFFQFPKRAHR
jgi:hypothetical protein